MNAQTNALTKIPETDSIFFPRLTGETYIQNRGYEGEQYYNIDFAESDILLTNGKMLYGEKLKYNGLIDEVIWLNTSNLKFFKLDKFSISDFWLKNIKGKTIHFKRINLTEPTLDNQSDIFVEVMVEGKVSLYIQRRIDTYDTRVVEKDSKFYNSRKIRPNPLYYIKLPSNRYLILNRLSRNSFLKLFPEQKKPILKILKANHLRCKSESELISIIELMNKERSLLFQ